MFAALNSFLTGALAKVTDVYWPFVSMLLHGDSPQQFNQDTSTNVFPISDSAVPIYSVASMQASTRTPFTGGPSSNGSGFFNGTNAGLTTPANTAFVTGTTSTIEMWVYPTVTTIQRLTNNGTGGGLDVFIYTGGVIYVNGANGGTTTALALNVWTHVAVVYNSGTLTIYFNGVSQSLIGVTTGYNFTANGTVYIGNSTGNAQFFSGYLSNVRVVKGVAVYTGNFTPPTASLAATQSSGTNISAITGTQTSLLTLQTNVPQNNNQFFDTSTNNFTLTRYGNTTQGSFNPFVKTYPYAVATNGGSGYFDGTGDYIQMPNNAAINFGSGDFTVECWVWKSTSVNAYGTLCMIGAGGSGFQGFTFEVSSTRGYAWYTQPSPFILLNYNVNPDDSTWHHVAISRTGSTTTMFVDGISRSTYSGSYTIPSTGTTFTVGAEPTPGSYYSGYISNLRLVKGTGLYTANFTPPTAPLTAVTNTALLLGMSNGAIYDNTMLNNLETVASAQISTSVFKYGTGSMLFNATTDYMPVPINNSLNFGTGNFTIECWVNPTFVTTATMIFASNSPNTYVALSQGANTSVFGLTAWDGTNNPTSTTSVTPVGQWTHVAFVRISGTLYFYINGVASGSGAFGNAFGTGSSGSIVGWNSNYVGLYRFWGYIDDLRLTKGIARYTTTFTPPTAAFPNLGPTYPSGTATQRAIFGYGSTGSVTAVTNIVSNTGVVASDTTGVGTARNVLAAAGYGGDKAIFGYGNTGSAVSITNLVSNAGVVATDTTGVGTARNSLAATGYSTDKAIFGYGAIGASVQTITNLVSNTGVVATDTAGVGTGRAYIAAARYGTDKGIFVCGSTSVSFNLGVALTNLVSNTGVVATDTAGVGTGREQLAAAGYGGDKAIYAYGYIPAGSSVSISNLVSNTGVVAADVTGVGTARRLLSASNYGGDKALFGYGIADPTYLSLTNLVSNTGVVATDTAGVGTARLAPAAAGFSYS